jgi:hypothetical protein
MTRRSLATLALGAPTHARAAVGAGVRAQVAHAWDERGGGVAVGDCVAAHEYNYTPDYRKSLPS